MPMLKVMIDGVEHKVKNDAKLIWEDADDLTPCELHLTCTHEGVVLDRIVEDKVESTTSLDLVDLHDLVD